MRAGLRRLIVAFVLSIAFPVHAEITVAAAASTQPALEEIAAMFEKNGGGRVRLVFGASANLARQIMQGAPFDIFLAADEQSVIEVHKSGHAADEGTLYSAGRLVLFVPKGSPIKADSQLADLARAVDDGRLRKLAIANPEHAPYGSAGVAALKHAGLWEKVQKKLVMGENISQAAQYAANGAAQAGLIALSLAMQPNFRRAGSYAVLPDAWHPPLRQRMVLLERGGDQARRFYTYLQQPAARTIFEKHGFLSGD